MAAINHCEYYVDTHSDGTHEISKVKSMQRTVTLDLISVELNPAKWALRPGAGGGQRGL